MNITSSSSSNSSGSNICTAGGSDQSSVYRGVRKRKWGKWVSEIRLPNSRERIWLGSYDAPEKAARAFDAALFCLRGRTAQFNFPNDPPDIPNGESLSRSEIQAAAARYANEEQHRSVHIDRNNNSNNDQYLFSVSDGVDYNSSTMDWELLDLMGKTDQNLTNINNGNDFMFDYGIFPGVNEFPGDFTTTSSPSEFDYGDDGEFSNQQSFLWNF